MASLKENMEPMEFIELSIRTNETKYQAQQRAILLEAVNNYLDWRNNKSAPDNRGYPITWFTWLRHYTAFGENRAKNLKTAFSSDSDTDPIELLQKHLQKNSKLNNHSLDTYLLEGIVNNKEVFCIGNEFTSMNTLSARTVLYNYLLGAQFSAHHYLMVANSYEEENNKDAAIVFYEKAIALNSIEAAIPLGKLYHSNLDLSAPTYEHEAQKAFDAYLIAAKQKQESALYLMLDLVEQVDIDAMRFKFALSALNIFANHKMALPHFKKLADKNVSNAVKKLKELAIKSPEYAYETGQLYEADDNAINYRKTAYIYYALAAQSDKANPFELLAKKQLEALWSSDKITGEEWYSLAMIYFAGSKGLVKDYAKAKECFKKASKNGYAKAYYYLGFIYQNAYGVEKNFILAAQYYQLADDNGFSDGKDKLDAFLHAKEITIHELITLASMYAQGNMGIAQNFSRAKLCYQIAGNRGDKSAAFALGQLSQINHVDASCEQIFTFQAYLQAATLGSYDALAPLERLGEEASALEQLELSNVYATFFHNPERAKYWLAKAKEVEQFTFKI